MENKNKPTRKLYHLKNGYTFQDRGQGSTARLYKGDWNDDTYNPYCIIHDEDIFKDFLEKADLIKKIEG